MINSDVLIIGAGPAGMAAAICAAKQGATVTILDEQSAPGGQIYRNVQNVDQNRALILGADYLSGRDLADQLNDPRIHHETSAIVWSVAKSGTVTYSQAGQAKQASGKFLIIATGALERPMPIPGWTLPGVMTVGAAQILLKSAGLLPKDAVMAGSGPLLYLVAAQMIAAGMPPRALIETQTKMELIRSGRYFGGALRSWKTLCKGLKLLWVIRKAGVRRYKAARHLRIEGSKQAKTVIFQVAGKTVILPCSTILLHQGVVPNTQISRSLQLEHVWNADQACFHPVLDAWGESSRTGIFLAGDGGGIAGAKAAEYSGQLAALEILHRLGELDLKQRDNQAVPIRLARQAETRVRPFLDRLYSPPAEVLRPADATIICRCEEVTAGDIRRFAKNGCVGPNQAKTFGRSGMGPCQGRYCGLTVTEILARENKQSHTATGSFRIRAPLKPVSLGEIANFSGATKE